MTGEDVSKRPDPDDPGTMEAVNAAGPEAIAAPPASDTLFCPQCGAKMAVGDRYCGECGWDAEKPDARARRTPPRSPRNLGPPSEKSRLTALLLCVLIGFLGAHRFYVGRAGSGIVWLLTLGVLSVGWIYDTVMIATGEFTDEDGRRVLYWE